MFEIVVKTYQYFFLFQDQSSVLQYLKKKMEKSKHSAL